MSGIVPRVGFGRSRQQYDRKGVIRRAGDAGPIIVEPDLDCSVIPAVDDNQRIDDDLVGAGGWIVVVPPDTDVKSADRILVGSQTFMVVRVLGPASHAAAWRVLCTET